MTTTVSLGVLIGFGFVALAYLGWRIFVAAKILWSVLGGIDDDK